MVTVSSQVGLSPLPLLRQSGYKHCRSDHVIQRAHKICYSTPYKKCKNTIYCRRADIKNVITWGGGGGGVITYLLLHGGGGGCNNIFDICPLPIYCIFAVSYSNNDGSFTKLGTYTNFGTPCKLKSNSVPRFGLIALKLVYVPRL